METGAFGESFELRHNIVDKAIVTSISSSDKLPPRPGRASA